MGTIVSDLEDPDAFSIEDEKFDLVFPSRLRKLSSLFWTPVAVAAEAARFLAPAPDVRVLDIGCGPGKFCLVAAMLSEAHFTGIEHRGELVAAAKQAAMKLKLTNVEFIHANMLEIDFGNYDAFYHFNPFEENMYGHKIDSAVLLSATLFKKYTDYVSEQLGQRPIGTRVVTYAGYADDIPSCYDCESTLFGDDLKFWIKKREYDPAIERLGLRSARSYRGSYGWKAPRK